MTPHRHSRGSVLFSALILVVGLVLLALAGGFSSVLEERLGRSYRDGGLAFNNAERAHSDIRRPAADSALAQANVLPLPECSQYQNNGYTPASGVAGMCRSTRIDEYLINRSRDGMAMLDALRANPPNAASGVVQTLPGWVANTAEGAVAAPRFLIERLETTTPIGSTAGGEASGCLSFDCEDKNTVIQFRVTARGFGPDRSDGAREPAYRTVESTFQ
ncbi:pilus assembly PilX family protein [Crenobacter cavernae]|uniref:Pilus assembly protein n=1 Tax=Crenobacter cavernae TaxID=2290923 RepID=A0ABY0FG79_9NEIS|nr:PilX N-terminal domain-containing pilus assembly protein [Crenobacter cavernae]RXZ45387.1 pilus assembly protein [Crenobacter cavernae]